MKKKNFNFKFICFFKFLCANSRFYGNKINVSNVCNSLGFSDDNDAKKYLDEICSAAGIHSNFIMVPCNSTNTCLAIEKDGNPFIIYDNVFLNNIKNSVSYGFSEKKISSNANDTKDWISLTILAHEIGHHQNQHFSKLTNSIPRLTKELQADEFAGNIIYRLGGSMEQGEQVYKSDIISTNPTSEHPGRADRIKAFEKGYNNAKGSQSSPSSSNNNKNLLVGNWFDGEKEVIMSFSDKGNYSISQKDKFYEGKWNIENNELVFYLNNSDKKWFSRSIIAINTYTLTLKNEESNLVGAFIRNNSSATDYSTDYLKKNWNKLIYIDKYDYTFREIGGLWNINIPLVNNTEFVLDLVRIKVDYYLKNYFGNSGIFKTEYLDYTNVKPHEKMTLKAPDSNRGVSVKQSIVKINSKRLNL